MRFSNESELPAALFRGILDRELMFASCALRVTYEWRGERLYIAPTQSWIVSGGTWDSPEGPMNSDELFYRGGVDLLVFGRAHALDGRAATRTAVEIRCGDFRHRLNVTGDRVWKVAGETLVPSEPEPFVTMPISADRAYGGSRPWDGIEVAFPDNPRGRGFCLDESDAVGVALPNIEHPACPIVRWSDRPDPVGMGLAPSPFGPRLREAVTFDAAGNMTELRPTFFNAAFPNMVLPQVRAGDRIELDGFDASGTIAFTMPAAPVELEMQIGEVAMTRVPVCDQIGVQTDKRQVFISYRYPFRYFIHAEEQRFCRLLRRVSE